VPKAEEENENENEKSENANEYGSIEVNNSDGAVIENGEHTKTSDDNELVSEKEPQPSNQTESEKHDDDADVIIPVSNKNDSNE